MSEPPSRPLDGLRVLDLSRALSGPFAGRILADLGADVVKVELPGADIAQTYGKVIRGRSGLYSQLNAGKRSVMLDLRQPGDAASRAALLMPGLTDARPCRMQTLSGRGALPDVRPFVDTVLLHP